MSHKRRYGLAGLSVWIDQHTVMPVMSCRCTSDDQGQGEGAAGEHSAHNEPWAALWPGRAVCVA